MVQGTVAGVGHRRARELGRPENGARGRCLSTSTYGSKGPTSTQRTPHCSGRVHSKHLQSPLPIASHSDSSRRHSSQPPHCSLYTVMWRPWSQQTQHPGTPRGQAQGRTLTPQFASSLLPHKHEPAGLVSKFELYGVFVMHSLYQHSAVSLYDCRVSFWNPMSCCVLCS